MRFTFAMSMLLSSALAATASAEEVVWITPGGGEFADPTNWSTGVVPGPADVAVFGRLPETADGLTVGMGARHTLQGLQIEAGVVTLVAHALGASVTTSTCTIRGSSSPYTEPPPVLHLDHCNLAISGTLNAEGSLWLQGATLGTHGIAPLELRGGATIEDESEWFHSGSSITVIDGRALIDASSVLHIAPGCNLRVGPPTRTNIPSLAVHGRLEAEGTGLITIAVSSALTVIGRLEAPERSIQVGSHPVSDQERTATFDVSGSAWVNDLRLSEFSEPTLGVAHARVRVTGGSLQVDDTVAVDTVGAEMTISDSGSVMVGNIEPLPDTLAIASSVTGDLQLHANLFVGPGATIEFGKIANLGSNDFPVHYVGGTITAVPGSLVAIWPGNKLQASGAAEVNGTLDLSRGEWRQPTQSTRWRALRAVPLVGEPDVISPDIPGLVPKYYRREATLMVAFNPALEGDVNSDGVVDTDDLARLLNGFGLFDKVWCDFDADDFIDLDDLMIILFNFGQTAEP